MSALACRNLLFLIAGWWWLAACAESGPAAAPELGCSACTAYAMPRMTGAIAPLELDELSGLTTSTKHPDLLFAHNDRDRALVYALDVQGELHARIQLADAQVEDLEDIAVGPCGSASCVYVADIGDNALTRTEYAIVRFREPELDGTGDVLDLGTACERYPFAYEDGSHNAESLLVAADETIYIITKHALASQQPASVVYKLAPPLSAAKVARAVKVASLAVPMGRDLPATAAAAHPCGLGFLLRTYDRVYEFRIAPGARFETAFSAAPQLVTMLSEPQSEGISYRAQGRGFVTSGEGRNAPLFVSNCE